MSSGRAIINGQVTLACTSGVFRAVLPCLAAVYTRDIHVQSESQSSSSSGSDNSSSASDDEANSDRSNSADKSTQGKGSESGDSRQGESNHGTDAGDQEELPLRESAESLLEATSGAVCRTVQTKSRPACLKSVNCQLA
jgi:hypothetical protein